MVHLPEHIGFLFEYFCIWNFTSTAHLPEHIGFHKNPPRGGCKSHNSEFFLFIFDCELHIICKNLAFGCVVNCWPIIIPALWKNMWNVNIWFCPQVSFGTEGFLGEPEKFRCLLCNIEGIPCLGGGRCCRILSEKPWQTSHWLPSEQ